MATCTPGGTRDLLGLPLYELYELKKITLKQYLTYWKCLPSFEEVWKECQEAIEQACKRERYKALQVFPTLE